MRLASGSKPITAFSVLQQVNEGKLYLDDPVFNYLPEITMDDPNWKQITIHHLL